MLPMEVNMDIKVVSLCKMADKKRFQFNNPFKNISLTSS